MTKQLVILSLSTYGHIDPYLSLSSGHTLSPLSLALYWPLSLSLTLSPCRTSTLTIPFSIEKTHILSLSLSLYWTHRYHSLCVTHASVCSSHCLFPRKSAVLLVALSFSLFRPYSTLIFLSQLCSLYLFCLCFSLTFSLLISLTDFDVPVIFLTFTRHDNPLLLSKLLFLNVNFRLFIFLLLFRVKLFNSFHFRFYIFSPFSNEHHPLSLSLSPIYVWFLHACVWKVINVIRVPIGQMVKRAKWFDPDRVSLSSL